MTFIAKSNRQMWFGTEDRMVWVPTPLAGADVSPTGWAAGGELLNGGSFQYNSFNSAKQYIFSWSASSSREAAQKMKSFADGSFGRGLLYFVDPLTYDTNILPAMWADPSMGIGLEGSTLVNGLFPTAGPKNSNLDMPVRSAVYNLATVAAGFRGGQDSVFLPIPKGYTLALGASYTFTGTGGVFYVTQSDNGSRGSAQKITPLTSTGGTMVNTYVSGPDVAGVWLYLGRSSVAASTATLYGLLARLVPTESIGTPSAIAVFQKPWIGGQGHSGCRFVGKPTYVNHSGVEGGRVEYAVTLKEVGSWVYG